MACGMDHAYTHKDTGTRIFSAESDIPSLYYKSHMNVNTDGAARSYHPQDPNGSSIAYNNIANAITVAWNASGSRITCDNGKAKNRKGACYAEYIRAFEGARDLNYHPDKFPRVKTGSMIPWSVSEPHNWARPCQIPDGPNQGFFVSQTSLHLKPGPECDQSIYVDSLAINAVVRTKKTSWKSQGIVTDDGDLVVLRNRKNGTIAYAIHGDSGPADAVGEGSIALTASLSGKTVLPSDTYQQIKKLSVDSVDYLIFPANDVIRHYGKLQTITQDMIDRYGAEVFEKWGGLARLESCSK